ncbi:MAG TPA: energy transducer TonB, partial [Pyrinomonadaceae bacterium]
PKPEYPPSARAARASGVVTVMVTVDESGNVIAARALAGHQFLRQTAEDAARRAKFSPTKYKGQPVKVMGMISYVFR